MTAPIAARPTIAAGEAVLNFWFHQSKPWQWFRRDDGFDAEIAKFFSSLHKSARTGRLEAWRVHPLYSLSLILLLDQFSRNIFRDLPNAFAADAQARDVANEAISRRFDMAAPPKRRAFFYMPFMHSEALADQDRSVALFKSRMPGSTNVPFAIDHRNIIAKFDRFPHRNICLGRSSTREEIAFLKAGGFNP